MSRIVRVPSFPYACSQSGYATLVPEARFVATSVDELVDLAHAADPPIRAGDRATVMLGQRVVLLEAHVVDDWIEWVEIDIER